MIEWYDSFKFDPPNPPAPPADGEIFVWESSSPAGWKVVEAWRDKHGCPYGRYVIVYDDLAWSDAVEYAKRLRKSFDLA